MCFGISTFDCFKIVEIDVVDIGYSGILKQIISPDLFVQIVRFHS